MKDRCKWIVLSVGVMSGVLVAGGCSTTSTQSQLPTETADGLQLQQNGKAGAVYLRPGVDFTEYQKIGLAPCQVSFRKNWMRDQNRDRLALDNRVTQQDMDRIISGLSEECDKFFKEALQEDPPYDLVESFHQGEPVLVIVPAIVNLDVTAPDLRTASRSYSFAASAGEMTLVLDIVDGTTRQSLAQVADRQQDPDFGGTIQWTNSVTNRSDADRILKSWSSRLREALDRVVRSQPQ